MSKGDFKRFSKYFGLAAFMAMIFIMAVGNLVFDTQGTGNGVLIIEKYSAQIPPRGVVGYSFAP